MLRMRAYQDGDSFPGFSPEPGKGLYFIALDGERLVGYCRWRLLPGKIGIETVEDSGDPLVFDGLVRGVLSIASDQGLTVRYFPWKSGPTGWQPVRFR